MITMELVRTFDECGYPSDDTLDCVSKLSPLEHDAWEIVDYILSIWIWGEMMAKIDKDKGCFQISTGGWSGNEDIITALQKSLFWMCYWRQTRCGGHYWFEIKPMENKQSTSTDFLERYVR